jgi:hypothetical protein
MLALRTVGIASLTIRSPDGNVVRVIVPPPVAATRVVRARVCSCGSGISRSYGRLIPSDSGRVSSILQKPFGQSKSG